MHIYQQLNPNDKINEKAEQKGTHRYKEHFDGYQMGQGLGSWV